MPKEPTLKFSLKAIEVIQQSIKPLNQEVQSKDFAFNIEIKHQIDTANSQVLVIVAIEVFKQKEKSGQADLISLCAFNVENLQDFILQKKPAALSSDAAFVLNDIAISTTRGIMYATFKGTYLHNVILPVVDAKVFRVPDE